MLFNSYAFLLVFLPAAIAIYRIADDYPRWRVGVLVVLSLIFYGYWDVRFVPLMLGSILLNWWASRLYVATKNSAVIVVAVVVNLAVLGLFKYANFFEENVAAVLGTQFEPLRLGLPLGISFFTFHHIMYLVDLRSGLAPLYSLDRYALYICFFPQAIAGPIARWNEVMHQFGRQAFGPGWERRCVTGTLFIVIGLFQKVAIADPLGMAIDPIYAQALIGPVHTGDAWMAFAFAFQVFFDFAGYSDIAIGLALIFGIELPLNFNAPFRAPSIQEIWRRWNMTLTRFLRDYVYISLGGNRHGYVRQIAAILITMILAGLWHGAGWHYLLWGALQGLGLAVAVSWREPLPRIPSIIGWAGAVGYFVGTIVIFRAGSLAAAWRVYEGLAFTPRFYSAEGSRTLILALIVAIVLPPSQVIVRWLSERPRPVFACATAIGAIIILGFIGREETHEFVYFQF
jgi:alginate O-acetyltransferase complex protein AlgI